MLYPLQQNEIHPTAQLQQIAQILSGLLVFHPPSYQATGSPNSQSSQLHSSTQVLPQKKFASPPLKRHAVDSLPMM